MELVLAHRYRIALVAVLAVASLGRFGSTVRSQGAPRWSPIDTTIPQSRAPRCAS
jgi:hypothetical protein